MSNPDTDLFNQLDAEIEDLTDQMTLLEHLDEMRRRVTVVGIAIVITTLFSLIFAPQLVEFLARPLDVPIYDDQGEVIGVTSGVEILQSIEVTENIGVFMRVSFLGGLILSMPIIFYQLIAFVVPGLTDKEKRFIMIAIPAATVLFLSGVAFAYFVMLPKAVPFLISFLGIKTAPRPANYFSFVTRLIFWIGVSFEMPLVMALLARLGVLSHSFLITNARYAVVIIAVLAAFITPTPDPLNMGLVMAPLILLYGLGIVLAKIFYQPRDSFVE